MCQSSDKKACKCPYCESELEMGCFEPAFCTPCSTKFAVCPKCNKPYKQDLKSCPSCNKTGGK